MSSAHSDRNLLFGILAMQMNFVSREDLIAVTSKWIQDKSQTFDELLVARKLLTDDERKLLSAVVEKHLQKHENDPAQSLAAIGSLAYAVCGELEDQLRTSNVETSLNGYQTIWQTEESIQSIKSQQARVRVDSAEPRFRKLRPHAKGGLGEVFVARDEELHRDVALKEIQQRRAFDQVSQNRFVLEAEITGALEHPGIVPVYSLGTYPDGRPYYAMRFIRGSSLADAIASYHNNTSDSEEKKLQFRELLKRFIDVCDAIGYAHSRGILHRDLKPANIMLGKFGETLVVDWGLAKALGQQEQPSAHSDHSVSLCQPISGSGSGTVAGETLGTPAYMSPEQAAGRLDELGPSTDVYSMGATLYQILAGKPSQAGEDIGQLLRNVIEGRFQPPSKHNPAVPTALEAVCLKAMERSPQDRYASVRDMAMDIERWLADEPVTAWREPWLTRTRRWIRRRPTLVAATSTLILASMIGMTVFSSIVSSQKREVEIKNEELEIARLSLESQKEQLESKNNILQATQQQLDAKNTELQHTNGDLIAAEEEARAQAETANASRLFMIGMLEETDPVALSGRLFAPASATQDTNRSIRDVVQAGTDQLEISFPNRDETRATLLHTLGNVWMSHGNYETAARLLNESSSIRQEILPVGHMDRVASIHGEGRIAMHQLRLDDSNRLFLEALSQCRELLAVDPPKFNRRDLEILLSDILFDLGIQWAGNQQHSASGDCEPLLLESLEIRRRHFGRESRQVCMVLVALAQFNIIVHEKMAPGLLYMSQAMSILDKLNDSKHFEQAFGQLGQAQLMKSLGQNAAAEKAYRECVRLLEDALGKKHIGVLFARRQLAQFLYWDKHDNQAALTEWSRLKEDYLSMHGLTEDVAYSHVQLARCFRNLGELASALEHGYAARDLYVAHPTYNLENFATCLDVLAHLCESDVEREVQIDGILLGPALEAAEKTRRQIFDVLTSRPVEQNQKAKRVLENSSISLKLHADQRAAMTATALDDLSKLMALPPEDRGALLELRIRLLLSLNRLIEATETASELAKFSQATMRQGLTAAQAFCRSAARLDPTESLDDKQRHERETLMDQAIQMLERCVAAGAVESQLSVDPHFAVLKDDPRFTKLLENK